MEHCRRSGTAQLLPRLIARRTRGPLFLTDRKAPAGTPTLDVCPETGRAPRLSYRRAEEIFEENTRLPGNPLASADDIEDPDGWTLHRLRHSAHQRVICSPVSEPGLQGLSRRDRTPRHPLRAPRGFSPLRSGGSLHVPAERPAGMIHP